MASFFEKYFEERLKEYKENTALALRRIIESDIASGNLSLKKAAQEDAYISGYYHLQKAALLGAANLNLRLMHKLLIKYLEQNVTSDRTNYLLNILSDLAEEEVHLLSKIWQFFISNKNINTFSDAKEFHAMVIPKLYKNRGWPR